MQVPNRNDEKIALDIVERSPSIALRITSQPGTTRWKTLFISKNIENHGYKREDFYSGILSYQDIIHPEDYSEVIRAIEENATANIDSYVIFYRIINSRGEVIWVSDASTVTRNPDGTVDYSDCVISDYSKAKRSQVKIEDNLRQQEVLNDILLSLHDSDMDKAFGIILDRTGDYLGISRAILFEDSEDHTQAQAVYEWVNQGIDPLMEDGFELDYSKNLPEVKSALDEKGFFIVDFGEIPQGSDAEFFKEGVIASAIFEVNMPDGRYGMICFDECSKERYWEADTIHFLSNIAQLVSTALIRKQSAEAVERMAYHDQLTDLNNRFRLELYLQEAIVRSRKNGTQGYVFFVDLDDFKIINDGYGHDYGDALLIEVARYFKGTWGEDAEVFRFGGDEFVLLLEEYTSIQARRVVEDILDRAQNPWPVLDKIFYCTISVGVVPFPLADEGVKEIIQNAEIAMYEAKAQGKNSYAVYDSGMDYEALSRAETENRMRHAIDNDFLGFNVHYQPMVNNNGALKGAEALIRWVDKQGKQMGPGAFVELAEYLGLIIPIGEFVMRNAMLECKMANEKLPDFTVSINVSIRQFQRQDFVDKVRAVLKETEVNPANIILEVTEGLAVHDLQQMKRILGELREMGIKVALDDFGTGYSSLNNMREIPLDIVKIDRSFIQDITTDAYSKTFVRLINDLCHSMGRSVCVEGVETREQLRYCVQFEADYIQGFYFWKPMPAEDLRMLIMEENPFPVDI